MVTKKLLPSGNCPTLSPLNVTLITFSISLQMTLIAILQLDNIIKSQTELDDSYKICLKRKYYL